MAQEIENYGCNFLHQTNKKNIVNSTPKPPAYISQTLEQPANRAIAWIIHIDMDAFYASIEQMDNPALRGLPVVVGGHNARGVVSAASYEARKFGVRSAMPGAMAKKLCPHAVFVPGRMARYKEISQIVMHNLQDFSPCVEPASIDEAYMDAQGLERLFGPIENLCQQIQRRIFETTGGLTCSLGAAPKKFLAKIASDIHKPHGIYIIHPEQCATFLQSLPVQKIPGVGKKFMMDLQKLGVRTVKDVYRFPEEFWQRRFGKGGLDLWLKAHGQDERTVNPISEPKSESAEITFEQDTVDKDFLLKNLFAQAERVGSSLRKKKLAGRTITLKIKFTDFSQITRSRTLSHSTHGTQHIFTTACELLESVEIKQKIRLIGLGVSSFEHHAEPKAEQGLLFPSAQEENYEREQKIDTAIDTLRQRFGRNVIVRGRLFSHSKKE